MQSVSRGSAFSRLQNHARGDLRPQCDLRRRVGIANGTFQGIDKQLESLIQNFVGSIRRLVVGLVQASGEDHTGKSGGSQ